ncbi:hypothetical protein [Hydrogenimonas cancrithermarum]|uniref:Uncharacterized protein n=1 Tax=Hydrogenimonas cancrithermarum TaxID=2993563 RepID=A0ABN6WWP6_9BACT|nr:hypothetical protein [Hydrogenimonas cancrithermarum]BDY13610.1 hypothetical protein HCR_19220 [Hydrogenimonas cancrithermarum]
MTLLFLLVAAAAGVVVLVYEKRLREENIIKLQNYLVKVVSDEKLLEREKMMRVIDLFTQNHYKIEDMKNGTLIVSRREFSVGAALLWLSVAGIGLILYLIYYFLKAPESLRIDLRTGTIHAD